MSAPPLVLSHFPGAKFFYPHPTSLALWVRETGHWNLLQVQVADTRFS